MEVFCEHEHHGGGWTLVLAAGIGQNIVGAQYAAEYKPFPKAFPDAPPAGSLNKMSDGTINVIRAANSATIGNDKIGFWVVTPTSGAGGPLGAEIFHKHGCSFKMGQTPVLILQSPFLD